ncbi:glycosyltransferase family 4 protein [Marinigracilibium pacificum]|uniref:Glycosyltransferase family 4 protein n=1 Tax=Marinigracilibium pacificum TaxID=2729599 RepID=A0A848J7U5_9BACT|nr:glycosyltransferase family 4 protein [Marinigracilibium pacificum]NMM50560.1 glycosyltransferase family 4 protein [Marinigracilibium pacificum]
MMNLGVILPHTKLYGGVKRFLELGNIFVKNGHSFTVFTPEGLGPDWFDFTGEMAKLEDINDHSMDAVFLTEIRYVDILANSNAKRKVFYHVRENEPMKKVLKHPEIEVFACSSNIFEHDRKRFKLEPFKAIGGIDTTRYQPKEISEEQPDTITIMMYGRLSEKRKGTMIAVKACEMIYKKNKNIKLLLFDSPVDEKSKRMIEEFNTKIPYDFVLNHPFDKNTELFHRADIFVAVEKRAGWANTVAEAMACGIPVVATESGTKDLLIPGETGVLVKRNRWSVKKGIESILKDPKKRKEFGKKGRNKIEEFDWNKLAGVIINHLQS